MVANVQASEQQFVVFELNGEAYGVEIERVQEINRLQPITAVAQMPPDVEGVINLRGQVTPIVNLRARLGLPPAESTPHTRIVIVMAGEAWLGLIVDAVSQVLRIPSAAIEPPPSMVGAGQAGWVRGIAKLDGSLVILLDLDQLVDQAMSARLTAAEAA